MSTNKAYQYVSTEKSFLDVRHDAMWEDTVRWIYQKYPKITPNHLTIMGVIPVILIIVLHTMGILGSIAFPLLSIALVWYLNMDAMDGKLARHSNRSTPIGQVMDHGLDALVGGLLSIMVASFLGFTNMIFYAITVSLTTLIFFQVSLKEHLTHEMMVSVKIYLGQTEDTAVIVSTTELLYGLSGMFFFGYFTIYQDLLFCFPSGVGLMGLLLYMNEGTFRQNIQILNGSRFDSTSASSEYSEYDDGRQSDRQNTDIHRNKKTKGTGQRREVYDSNMRPTGDYAGFDLFPHPEVMIDSDADQDTGKTQNHLSLSNINLSDLTNLRRSLEKTPYFTFGTTLLLNLVLYVLTAGAVSQLLMMVLYITTVTVDMIFLNTLRLDLTDKKSRVLTKRFASRNVMVFSALKLVAYVIGLLTLLIGLAPSLIVAFGLTTVVDMFFLIFYATHLMDKTDLVTSYFDKND